MTDFDLDLVLHAEGDITLSRPTHEDTEQVLAACRDAEIARFTRVPWPYTADDAATFVRISEDGARDGTALNLLARDADGRVLGAVGLPRVDAHDRVGEVGYWVASWARRRGVATRTARAVCRWSFDHGLARLTLEAATINPGSNGVARALGFTLEGTQRQAAVEGATDREPPPRLDMNVWGLLPGELT